MLRKYYVSFAAPNTYYTIAVQPNYQNFVKEFNRKWHISTTPHKTKNNRTLSNQYSSLYGHPELPCDEKTKIQNKEFIES